MDEYGLFCQRIRSITGIDLNLYKEKQMRRRIESFMQRYGENSLINFAQRIQTDPKIQKDFLSRITINVTEFVRNAGRWDVLRGRILPELLNSRAKVNIWSAACSTGEEPYSLAMSADQCRPNSAAVLATDLDTEVLAAAQAGIYSAETIKTLPKTWVDKYFSLEDDKYQVKPSLARAVTFKRHNLLADPYPQGLDLAVCRNVLIYFTEDAKDYVYKHMVSALRPGGVLFVGSTEQIFRYADYGLELVDSFFYRKK